jgi:hypothetical protein
MPKTENWRTVHPWSRWKEGQVLRRSRPQAHVTRNAQYGMILLMVMEVYWMVAVLFALGLWGYVAQLLGSSAILPVRLDERFVAVFSGMAIMTSVPLVDLYRRGYTLDELVVKAHREKIITKRDFDFHR